MTRKPRDDHLAAGKAEAGRGWPSWIYSNEIAMDAAARHCGRRARHHPQGRRKGLGVATSTRIRWSARGY